jgi:hypothetical protein
MNRSLRSFGTALFAVAVIAPLFRERGVPVWDNIWVEDGPVYGRHVLESGVSSAFRGYFGYLQFMDRALALPVAILPSAWWSAYFAVVSTFVWALAAAFVYRTSAAWISSSLCRLAVCAVIVLSPAAAWETNASISNAMWAALLVVPFAFVTDRRGVADTALRAVAVFLGITSSPLAIFFLPIGLAMAITRRRRSEVVVLLSFAAGLAIQAAATLTTGIEAGTASPWLLVADLYGLRVVGSALMGELPLDALWTEIGEPAVLVILVVFIAIAGTLLARAAPAARRRAALFIGLSVVLFVVPIVGRGTKTVGFDYGVYTLSFTRLTIVPIILLVTAIAMLVDPVPRTPRPPDLWRKAFVVQTAVVVLLGYSVTSARGAEPGWSAARAHALAVDCAGRADGEPVVIPTTPSTFTMQVTCGRLRSG